MSVHIKHHLSDHAVTSTSNPRGMCVISRWWQNTVQNWQRRKMIAALEALDDRKLSWTSASIAARSDALLKGSTRQNCGWLQSHLSRRLMTHHTPTLDAQRKSLVSKTASRASRQGRRAQYGRTRSAKHWEMTHDAFQSRL